MTRAWPVLAAIFTFGCTSWPPHDTSVDTGDTGTTNACPSGMSAAHNAGILFSAFEYDGLGYSPLYADGTYLNRPAACISSDGHSVDYLFLLDGNPYGRIKMSAPAGGQSYDLNGTQATLEIELFGESDDPTFGNGEFQSGSWYVTSVGSTFDSDVDGDAIDSATSHELAITYTLQGTR